MLFRIKYENPRIGVTLLNPEQEARLLIDENLKAAGWVVQSADQMNPYAARGVAVREIYLEGVGKADYLLFVDQKAVGVVEAKKAGTTLSGIAEQSANYAAGIPAHIPRVEGEMLPFLYQSTGIETTFRDERDPEPRSRQVFNFHRPETLSDWVSQASTLRSRLQALPPLDRGNLWPAQVEAIENLEISFAANKPRAVIQMATGSGKTYTAINFIYRLIKFAKANRILFLVDRNNLGRQARNEFANFITPDDGRKFTELYNVQHLQSNVLDPVSKVHITTIQRLYSMLSGEPEYDPANEETSLFLTGATLERERPEEVLYNPAFPIEYYDFIVIDECHRSIYKLWRQVFDYFDSFLIGLTATPNKLTFGFFHKNLVMEYTRQRAVVDGVNVDGDVYQIKTKITEQGSVVEAGQVVGVRDRQTRKFQWEELDDDLVYDAAQLDREVMTPDQIRTIIRTFRDRLFTDIFPGRSEVPKTLIFAKDDNHAEEIVEIVREEFNKGDDFCKKITYKVSGISTDELIRALRNDYYPRIAVTVDMIATGTDVRPLEILLFMRNVKSRGLFEQMIGRGTRVIDPTEFQSVTRDAASKTHFVIVDAVGVIEQEKYDTQTFERLPGKSLVQLLDLTKFGIADEDTLSSLASRLVRMGGQLDASQHAQIEQASGGLSLRDLTGKMLDAIDPDTIEQLRQSENISTKEAQERLARAALFPFASKPELRNLLAEIRRLQRQVIDTVSIDEVRQAGYSQEASEKARQMVEAFRRYIEENKDVITALQILFGRPRAQARLTFEQVKELAEKLQQPPNSWTTENLWRAYAQIERDRVHGLSEPRVLADVVSLVRHAVSPDGELAPYPEIVQKRYREWLAAQEAAGKTFNAEQRWWLDEIARHIGVNAEISLEDLGTGRFHDEGGVVRVRKLFGSKLKDFVEELNINISA
jgi:type I restriction enzyme R subunit